MGFEPEEFVVSEQKSAASKSAQRVIKKYPNRRLYDTETSTYITLAEVKDLLLRTAEARQWPGAHEGFAHWTAGGSSASLGYATTYGPGANPFCQGCWTAPVGWNTVPDAGVSAYPLVGFGAVNERSLAAAGDALRGADLPARSIERALFDADQAARAPLY